MRHWIEHGELRVVLAASWERWQNEKTVTLPNGKSRTLTALTWNPTIANLSLMALGSSAPEILLSVIEIMTSGFYAGELGPSTIVGSAAFNMLVISAVCVIAIPDGEGRYIKETTGALPPEVLFQEAIKVLMQKVSDIATLLQDAGQPGSS